MDDKKPKLWWHDDPERRAKHIQQDKEWRSQLTGIGKALAEYHSTKAETDGLVVNKPLSIGKKDE
jgi:hypothetical protein